MHWPFLLSQNWLFLLVSEWLIPPGSNNEYKKEYKSLKNVVEKMELEKVLYPLKKRYKAFVQSDKEEKEYIENLELNEVCKELDMLFVFGVFQ